MKQRTLGTRRAFTIVELLIVVVVIAILAAITIVAYNGITANAKDSALKSDLSTTAKKVGLVHAEQGAYPTTKPLDLPDYIQYSQTNAGQGFCATASKEGRSFNITQNGVIQGGECPPAPAVAIQTITATNCPETRTLVVDARDNRTYYIQRLGAGANARCWMLTNLAYAGGTSNGGVNIYSDAIPTGDGSNGTLNGPDNTGSASNTLAKYYAHTNASPTANPTLPTATTDGGATNTQYGYHYNWCAAMGAQNNPSGANTAACANATTPAPDTTKSICPAGWRLPTQTPVNEFTLLNTAVNGAITNADTGLRTIWLGQYGSVWSDAFHYQGSYGAYWSSTQRSATYAHYLEFNSSGVYPLGSYYKENGYSVRCVAI